MSMPSAFNIVLALHKVYWRQSDSDRGLLKEKLNDQPRSGKGRFYHLNEVLHVTETEKASELHQYANQYETLRYENIRTWVNEWDIIDWESLMDLANHIGTSIEHKYHIIRAEDVIFQEYSDNEAAQTDHAQEDPEPVPPGKFASLKPEVYEQIISEPGHPLSIHRTFLGPVTIPPNGRTEFARHYGHELVYVLNNATIRISVRPDDHEKDNIDKELHQGDLFFLSSWHSHVIEYISVDDAKEEDAQLIVGWPMLSKRYYKLYGKKHKKKDPD